MIGAIRELAAPGRLVVIASHDERMIPLADQVIELTANFRDLTRPPGEIALMPGDYLFRQGAPANLIYVVQNPAKSRWFGSTRTAENSSWPCADPAATSASRAGVRPAAHRRRPARGATQVTGYTLRDFRKLFGDDPALAKLLSNAAGDRAEPANGERPPEVRRALADLGSAVQSWWRGG